MEAFSLSYDGAMQDTELSSNIAMLYPETASFVWIIFLVLIPILLTNMLVSYTVYLATLLGSLKLVHSLYMCSITVTVIIIIIMVDWSGCG